MARRLILDTGAAGVLIGIERTGTPLAFAPDDDVAIAAVTAAEPLLGIELADDARRQDREDFVTAVLAVVPVEEYGLEVAGVPARLPAHVRRQGKPRGAHDLIIAATAAALDGIAVSAVTSGAVTRGGRRPSWRRQREGRGAARPLPRVEGVIPCG